MNLVRGADFSRYDSLLDWDDYNLDFAFIKVSEGTVMDNAFPLQWREAKGHTIRSGYHFFRPFVDPLAAARKFVDLLDGDLGELPPALDLEVLDGQTGVGERALDWLHEVEHLTHIRPIVYSSPGFLNNIHACEYPELSEYKFWLATYPYDEICATWTEEQRERRLTDIFDGRFLLATPPPPKPFRRVSFWQFTGKGDPGLVGGYTGAKEAVDLDLYNGETVADLCREFGITQIPGPSETGDDMPVLFLMDLKPGYTANVRDNPNGNILGTITGFLTVQITGNAVALNGFDWYPISSPRVGWVAKTTQFENLRPASLPADPTVTLKHTVEVYSDGSLKVDGNLIA